MVGAGAFGAVAFALALITTAGFGARPAAAAVVMAAGPGAAAWFVAGSGVCVLVGPVNGLGALAVGDGLAACGLGAALLCRRGHFWLLGGQMGVRSL